MRAPVFLGIVLCLCSISWAQDPIPLTIEKLSIPRKDLDRVKRCCGKKFNSDGFSCPYDFSATCLQGARSNLKSRIEGAWSDLWAMMPKELRADVRAAYKTLCATQTQNSIACLREATKQAIKESKENSFGDKPVTHPSRFDEKGFYRQLDQYARLSTDVNGFYQLYCLVAHQTSATGGKAAVSPATLLALAKTDPQLVEACSTVAATTLVELMKPPYEAPSPPPDTAALTKPKPTPTPDDKELPRMKGCRVTFFDRVATGAGDCPTDDAEPWMTFDGLLGQVYAEEKLRYDCQLEDDPIQACAHLEKPGDADFGRALVQILRDEAIKGFMQSACELTGDSAGFTASFSGCSQELLETARRFECTEEQKWRRAPSNPLYRQQLEVALQTYMALDKRMQELRAAELDVLEKPKRELKAHGKEISDACLERLRGPPATPEDAKERREKGEKRKYGCDFDFSALVRQEMAAISKERKELKEQLYQFYAAYPVLFIENKSGKTGSKITDPWLLAYKLNANWQDRAAFASTLKAGLSKQKAAIARSIDRVCEMSTQDLLANPLVTSRVYDRFPSLREVGKCLKAKKSGSWGSVLSALGDLACLIGGFTPAAPIIALPCMTKIVTEGIVESEDSLALAEWQQDCTAANAGHEVFCSMDEYRSAMEDKTTAASYFGIALQGLAYLPEVAAFGKLRAGFKVAPGRGLEKGAVRSSQEFSEAAADYQRLKASAGADLEKEVLAHGKAIEARLSKGIANADDLKALDTDIQNFRAAVDRIPDPTGQRKLREMRVEFAAQPEKSLAEHEAAQRACDEVEKSLLLICGPGSKASLAEKGAVCGADKVREAVEGALTRKAPTVAGVPNATLPRTPIWDKVDEYKKLDPKSKDFDANGEALLKEVREDLTQRGFTVELVTSSGQPSFLRITAADESTYRTELGRFLKPRTKNVNGTEEPLQKLSGLEIRVDAANLHSGGGSYMTGEHAIYLSGESLATIKEFDIVLHHELRHAYTMARVAKEADPALRLPTRVSNGEIFGPMVQRAHQPWSANLGGSVYKNYFSFDEGETYMLELRTALGQLQTANSRAGLDASLDALKHLNPNASLFKEAELALGQARKAVRKPGATTFREVDVFGTKVVQGRVKLDSGASVQFYLTESKGASAVEAAANRALLEKAIKNSAEEMRRLDDRIKLLDEILPAFQHRKLVGVDRTPPSVTRALKALEDTYGLPPAINKMMQAPGFEWTSAFEAELVRWLRGELTL